MKADGSGGAVPWRGRAFGLDLRADFPIPGVVARGEPRGDREATLRRATSEEASEWRRRLAAPEGLGPPSVLEDADGAYLLAQSVFGHYRVSPAGDEVVCAPEALEDWQWQRMLTGQLIPLAAVLSGLEVLHSSAVTIGDRALLFMGGTAAGKSTLAANMVAGGAAFLTDDVVALERRPDGPVAHAGAGVLTLDRDAFAELRAGGRSVGARLGDWYDEVRVSVEVGLDVARIGAVYVLAPRAEGDEIRIERMAAPSPRSILGAAFTAYVRTPSRLHRQLAAGADLVATAPIFSLLAPRGLGARQLADAVRTHAERAVGDGASASRRSGTAASGA